MSIGSDAESGDEISTPPPRTNPRRSKERTPSRTNGVVVPEAGAVEWLRRRQANIAVDQLRSGYTRIVRRNRCCGNDETGVMLPHRQGHFGYVDGGREAVVDDDYRSTLQGTDRPDIDRHYKQRYLKHIS
jgi:hypothetical protein